VRKNDEKLHGGKLTSSTWETLISICLQDIWWVRGLFVEGVCGQKCLGADNLAYNWRDYWQLAGISCGQGLAGVGLIQSN
jgi:hypothetical protein